MGRPTDPPTFPVIDDDPAAGKVFQSFRGSDWRNFALTTGFSIPFGYWAGTFNAMRFTRDSSPKQSS